MVLGAGGLGNTLVLAWELLNIDCGRKVCMLMRDRRLVGPGEPLDLVVPVLWDDRGGINARRSTSSLESAGGESSRCLHHKGLECDIYTPLSDGARLSGVGLTRRGTSASRAD